MKANVKNTIIILITVLIIAIPCLVLASDMTSGINISSSTKNEFADIGNKIFGIVRVVGIIAAVAVLMLLGIKYMMGSVEEKAEYKKTFIIYFVGFVLVIGITSLLQFIYNIVN